eukprot:TRINITY_DN136_c2_g2_i2.p1 TRINITY_DN136_c2_g2~~TRINITY_DN136_c2_g2_i2.p1  ORF type:complete len:253 (-),score=90.21 TRINITY_DN136_c2_g2_i2:138-896(-)
MLCLRPFRGATRLLASFAWMPRTSITQHRMFSSPSSHIPSSSSSSSSSVSSSSSSSSDESSPSSSSSSSTDSSFPIKPTRIVTEWTIRKVVSDFPGKKQEPAMTQESSQETQQNTTATQHNTQDKTEKRALEIELEKRLEKKLGFKVDLTKPLDERLEDLMESEDSEIPPDILPDIEELRFREEESELEDSEKMLRYAIILFLILGVFYGVYRYRKKNRNPKPESPAKNEILSSTSQSPQSPSPATSPAVSS